MSIIVPRASLLYIQNLPPYLYDIGLFNLYKVIADAGNRIDPSFTLKAEYNEDNKDAFLSIEFPDCKIAIKNVFERILLNDQEFPDSSIFGGMWVFSYFNEVIFTPNTIILNRSIYMQRVGSFFIIAEFDTWNPKGFVIDLENKIGFPTNQRLVLASKKADVGYWDTFKILGVKQEEDALYVYPIGESDIIYYPTKSFTTFPFSYANQNIWFAKSHDYTYYEYTMVFDVKEKVKIDFESLNA